MLQTTLPKRHITRGIPSIVSVSELAVPKVSCMMKISNYRLNICRRLAE